MGPEQAAGLPHILAMKFWLKEKTLAAAQQAHGFG